MNPVDPDGYEQHPLLNRIVRDIASRGEGVLVAVTHELHSNGTVRIAHIRPKGGIEWTTAADNIQLLLPGYAPGPAGASTSPSSRSSSSPRSP
ncbi:hypothetical protein [Streptomyces sp. TRM49041]|uniref:hypothetical protein n=1 Tax=Streptomyces sp. TRM49041 TaxID=2603216 RepID=UPI0021CD0305|nr:hypothetical protein [Streptomyces sp. TRM49041]